MAARQVVGIDEVGRGCLAGPVVAAAVVLGSKHGILGLNDSKCLSAKKRLQLSEQVRKRALMWAIGRAEACEIDLINVHNASLLAMRRAFLALKFDVSVWVKVDGKYYPDISTPGEAIIKGDQLVDEIAAASIVAKVARDREMILLDRLCPGYGFSQHKGYPSRLHLECIQHLGVTCFHRRSYRPVREYLQQHKQIIEAR